MRSQFLHPADSSVYPGEYIPLLGGRDFNVTLRQSAKNKSLPVNIQELVSCYKIELAIPGVRRENLFLEAIGNILSVSVLHNDRVHGKQNYHLHGLNFDHCLTHTLVLPDDADPVFVSAEFKAGILHICIPKSAHPLKTISTKIAIY